MKVVRARVEPDGRLPSWARADITTELQAHVGEEIEVVIRRPKRQRSVDQNAYIHAVPIPMLAEHFGYSIPEMKLVLMGECWGWQRNPLSGRDVPVKPSTATMTVEECQYFIDWVIPWAAVEHGVIIPLPNEVEVAA